MPREIWMETILCYCIRYDCHITLALSDSVSAERLEPLDASGLFPEMSWNMLQIPFWAWIITVASIATKSCQDESLFYFVCIFCHNALAADSRPSASALCLDNQLGVSVSVAASIVFPCIRMALLATCITLIALFLQWLLRNNPIDPQRPLILSATHVTRFTAIDVTFILSHHLSALHILCVLLEAKVLVKGSRSFMVSSGETWPFSWSGMRSLFPLLFPLCNINSVYSVVGTWHCFARCCLQK